MRTFKKLLITTATTAALISTVAQAKQTVEPQTFKGFTEIQEKAQFIHGNNLIEGPLFAVNSAKGDDYRSLEERASALDTVMVSREGTQYVKKMNPQDLAIFEKAVADLERLGLDSSVFDSPRRLPANFDKLDPSQRSVIGSDGRDKVTNTVQDPYWYIGRIGIGCTGTLVGPKHVLTAGHCVSDGNGNWYSALDFTVGQNGSYKPWGSEGWANAMTVSEWHNGANWNYDYAMIILDAAPHGGYESYGKYSGGTHTVTGYPGDKPFGTMWTDTGSTTSDSRKIYYTLDTAGGQSGSGIRDSGNTVRGIHAYGVSNGKNSGTKIQNSVYNQIQSWISSNP